jgi:hypothetical protein
MATRRYKITAGETYKDIVQEVGAATNSDAIELTVDLASTIVNLNGSDTRALTKDEVVQAVEQIKLYIIENNWPPA